MPGMAVTPVPQRNMVSQKAIAVTEAARSTGTRKVAFRGSLQDIRLFVAAYEEESFTAAAVREGSTQSGVSHHIRHLETILKVKLFVREKARITATPAGDDYYRHCVELLRSLDKATDSISRFAGSYESALEIGVMPALTHRIVAPTLLRFSERHPNVKVRIVESYSTGLPAMVAAGDLDFAIGTVHGPEAGVRSRALLTSPECLIARREANDAGLDDGPGQHKIVWATGMQSRRNAIDAWFTAHGIAIDASLEIDSSLATLDMVSRSAWKTVTPALMLDPLTDADRFTATPFHDPQISLSVMLIERMRSEMSPEGAEFVELLVEEANRVSSAWDDHFRERGFHLDTRLSETGTA
ncbi:MAG: LysR family transcriptional regulator [Sphingosinicella sp.]|nr:LysR family transcriptional regulator [Sphingosinicella sp.]